MSGHTPGPWIAGDRTDCIAAGDVCVVCFGHDYDDYGGVRARAPEPWELAPYQAEANANARLIAAAPDLLEACRLAMPFIEAIYREHGRAYLPNSGDALEVVQAAIAKAEEGK